MTIARPTIKHIFELQLVLFIIGLFFSQFILSAVTGTLVITAFVAYMSNRNSNPFDWKRYLKDYQYVALSLIFVAVVISGVNSSNTGEWLHQVKMKVIFLVLPWAFYYMQLYYRIDYMKYLYIFVAVAAVSTIPIVYNYAMDFDALTKKLGQGQAIPTKIDHIIYSLILAFSGVSSCILWYLRKHKTTWQSLVWLVLGLYLISVLHVLAVRSGLFTFYASSILTLIGFIIYSRKYIWGVTLLAIIMTGPIAAYYLVPSVHKKLNYMKYDYDMYSKGDASNYSDSGRIYSLQAGYALWKESPILGTGIGDLKEACSAKYKQLFSWENNLKLYPHNQYLFVLAGMGVLGFLFFVFGLCTPMVVNRNYANIFVVNLYLFFLCSFIVNNTFERSVGFSFFCFCLLIVLRPSSMQKKEEL